jgi:hypothetical protein
VERWCLVVGSYPPVPGPASAATVAAVERAWAAGYEVRVMSPRPSAAARVLAFDGPGFAAELGRRCRRGPYQRVVVCAEPGWPFPAEPGLLSGPRRTARRLARALATVREAELVLTGPVADMHQVVLALPLLWPSVGTVSASTPALAAAAAALAPEALVAVAAPSTRRLPLDELVGGATPPLGRPGVVGPMEPGQMSQMARARRLAGRTARTLLGSHEPAVRSAAGRSLGRLRSAARSVPGLRRAVAAARAMARGG